MIVALVVLNCFMVVCYLASMVTSDDRTTRTGALVLAALLSWNTYAIWSLACQP